MTTAHALLALAISAVAFGQTTIAVSGHVTDPVHAAVPGAKVRATDGLGRTKAETSTDQAGVYKLELPAGGLYSFVATAEGFEPIATEIRQVNENLEGIDLEFGKLQSASDVVNVTERIIEPAVDQRDKEIFNKTLFTRDDQIFQTLGAGLSLGQHAGGGKSLEVRRFGFNLDHGGVGGGLRVVQDNLLLNQVSGGHAHGYLGALKGLSPELVQDVSLINGPFNAQYGDFSGLGVVNIQTKSEMPDRLTARVQYGQYNTRRLFGAYSPQWKNSQGLIAIEHSYSDGPYIRPLEYGRNNLTGVYSRRLSETETFILRVLGSTNNYYAAGQLPVDAIDDGRLNRFGFVDPTDGGTNRSGTLAAYYTKEHADGSTLKFDGMVNRVLFDLFSNFTFFLEHPQTGDGFGQHDSRLQEALNGQYQRPHSVGNAFGNFFAGVNHLDNQINLALYGRQGRVPTDLRTFAHVRIANSGLYAQENVTLLNGKLRLDGGLRYDTFYFRTQDRLTNDPAASRVGGAWQPKAAVAYTPSLSIPFTVHANYGRAVSSTNSRALLADPSSVVTALTDFFQVGASHNRGRFSAAASYFLIRRSNEMIYTADNGTNEFVGPTQNHGFETKTSWQLTRAIALNASITKVFNAYYRNTFPREYIDRAPHFVAYTGLTVSNWKGWSGSARMRSINHYILNGEDATNPSLVPGHTVFDFNVARPINRWLELNFAVDNLLNRSYYETFEKYVSALRRETGLERVHATTGYPRTIMAGITIRLFPKER